MSYNSKQYLTHAENIATGTVVVTGTYRRHKPVTDKNVWYNNLTDAEREQLRREAEYEQSKNEYR